VTLAQASNHIIYTSEGQPIPFHNLLNPVTNSNTSSLRRRILLIFVRHFFCNLSQSYITHLPRPSQLPKHTSIIIIGCGAPSLIPSYTELTQTPYPIYTDPSAALYSILGMQRSLSMGSRSPAYIEESLVLGWARSVVQGLKRVPMGDVASAGALDLQGGEFLFEIDARTAAEQEGMVGWSVPWRRRMKNSRDHTEVEDLMAVLSDGRQTAALKGNTGVPINGKGVARRPTTPKRSSSLRSSLSLRRQTWASKLDSLAQSNSVMQRIKSSRLSEREAPHSPQMLAPLISAG